MLQINYADNVDDDDTGGDGHDDKNNYNTKDDGDDGDDGEDDDTDGADDDDGDDGNDNDDIEDVDQFEEEGGGGADCDIEGGAAVDGDRRAKMGALASKIKAKCGVGGGGADDDGLSYERLARRSTLEHSKDER